MSDKLELDKVANKSSDNESTDNNVVTQGQNGNKSAEIETQNKKRYRHFLLSTITVVNVIFLVVLLVLIIVYQTGNKEKIKQLETQLQQKIKGPPWSKGSKGEPDTDIQGYNGTVGEKRKKGDKGVRGEKGIPGDKGQRGETGRKGEIGHTGLRGLVGLQGRKGEKGQQGSPGLKGSDGRKGNKGEYGEKGSFGDTGLPGLRGTKGERGVKGVRGDKGTSGEAARTTCGDGWVYFRSSCYFFERKRKLNWFDAQKYCKQLGGSLAKVDNTMEAYFLKSFMKVEGLGDAFIGLNDIKQEGIFIWADGSVLTIKDWVNGEPNNTEGREDCVVFNRGENYKWNDVPCSTKFLYVCEKNP